LRRAVPIEQKFALVQHDGKNMLMEFRHNEGGQEKSGEIDQRTRFRINNLAGLLSQPKEQVFCIPRCIGWEYLPAQNNIAVLFEIAQDRQPRPISLFQLLDLKGVKLGQRFHLALALSRCITQLRMVKWVRLLVHTHVFISCNRLTLIYIGSRILSQRKYFVLP
jgi:hypothetical protein